MNLTDSITLGVSLLMISSAAIAYEAMLDHEPTLPQISDPRPDRFSVCLQHTCSEVRHLALTPMQWNRVRETFSPPSATAAEERARIAEAIGYLEIEVGKEIDTLNDVGGSFEGFVTKGKQLDCIDESTNSTTYLRMMQDDGLLRFHQVAPKATRARSGFFFIGWPHTSAVITETANGEKWAVDSWFRNNGVPADVVPMSQWKSGWSPES